MGDLKLGLAQGYWGAAPNPNFVEMAQEAEKLGYDSVWSAEAWGNDAFTPLCWIGAQTSKIQLGTAVVQLSGRTPTSCAMHALSLDYLSGGRFNLGLGVSGPQVVEGWYGRPFPKPLARTREYIDIIRQVFKREGPVTNAGPHYPLPYPGDDGMGLGKPLKPIVHPLRNEIPIFMGAEGPKNIALSTEIADGWIPLFYNPYDESVYEESLINAPKDFQINQMVTVNVTDDIDAALLSFKYFMSFYVGGMGAKNTNFHKDLFIRMGFEEEAEKIQQLFFEDKRDEAARVIPDELADAMTLVGPKERIKERLQAWRDSRVTTLLVSTTDKQQLREVADLVL
ncbi:LLM class F420-dependent oxidoreductase [Halieaceae bacterium IMCC14734]|uniref:LLM class F420-dependent oxidoreductase n=1 Tax=Candidatus Litorirhabdus singularis TaxID=2518993 RepID=A0ABT3TD06_9GAMM|nr:LLM class F420-dependent oxidoreductase [Candidatus Litorirhabdus singularis]MCX2980185.1 LLM class F420-dependent oxidoreductase [Candidatus Litorirhabdus singularis]